MSAAVPVAVLSQTAITGCPVVDAVTLGVMVCDSVTGDRVLLAVAVALAVVLDEGEPVEDGVAVVLGVLEPVGVRDGEQMSFLAARRMPGYEPSGAHVVPESCDTMDARTRPKSPAGGTVDELPGAAS